MARRVLITVAELSGDHHAANLIRELRKLDPEIIVDALGGQFDFQAEWVWSNVDRQTYDPTGFVYSLDVPLGSIIAAG